MMNNSSSAVILVHTPLVFVPKNQDAPSLRAINGKDYDPVDETPLKKLNPKQLMACAALRLFGIDSLQIKGTNKGFACLDNYTVQHVIEADFTAPLNQIKNATQFVREFNKSEEMPESGKIHKNSVSEYKSGLMDSAEGEDVVSFSKVMAEKEIVIVYNTAETDAKERFILMHNNTEACNVKMSIVYGYEPCGFVHLFHGDLNGNKVSYIKIYLKPLQLIILKNY